MPWLFVFFFLLRVALPAPAYSATFAWTDTSSGNSQEDFFVLERGPCPAGPFTDFVHAPQDSTSSPLTVGPPGTTECFRLKATNATGSSPYSNVASFTTPTNPAVGSPTIVCTYSATSAPPAGLVLALNLNAGAGTTASDTSGQNNHGTITGATWTTSGKYGKALVFNGTSNWVTVNDANSLDLTTGMTIEAWVYPTANGGGTWRNVMIKERTGGEVYNLYANVDTNVPTVYVVLASAPSAPVGRSGTAQLPLNTWTHLAATYDGTALRLYVNGTQVGSQSVSGPLLTSTGALRIGGNSIWGEYFQGRIDEVRIYNRALTAPEIVTDRDTPIP